MSRTIRFTILFLALALLWMPVRVTAQVPLISQIVPQPTSAGTATSFITITGSNFGFPTDTVTFPGNPLQVVSPTSWSTGSLTVPVPGTWSGTISVFSGSPSPSENFLVSFHSAGDKWHVLPVHWELNQNGAPGVAIANVAWALNVAYDTWECASGFDHTYDGLTTRDGSNHNDGFNVQYWGTTPWANPNLIAVATYTYNPTTHQIFEADIHYNGADWSWSAGGSATTVDIQHVATHESGHTIGLLDLYGAADNQKTMYGSGGNNLTFARSLRLADVQGAEYLYPHAGRGNSLEGTPSGWWGPIVPRETSDATSTFAPLPSSLPGYTEIFASFAETNNGLDCLAPGGREYVYLDGQAFNNGAWSGVLAPGSFTCLLNQPVTVPGGRHTLRIDRDTDNELVESNENDNTFKAQFVWSPFGLADQHPEVRPPPPPRGTLAYPNCEGFMFTGNWWGAVAIIPTNPNDDYDLFLFDDYTGSTAGYQTPIASSWTTPGIVDFVLVNGNIVGEGETRWVGTVRASMPVGADVVVQQSNQVGPTYYPVNLYGSSSSTGTRLLVPNQIIKVHEFYLADTSVTYEFEMKNLSGGADLDLAVFDAAVDYHALSDAVAEASAYGAGADEKATYQPPMAGHYGVAVYKFSSEDLPLDASYELICRVAPPNLDATDYPSGHDYPLVPRNTTGASSGNVHLTSTLDGNMQTTYLNYSVEQEGPNDCPQWLTSVTLDNHVVLDEAWSGEPVPVTSVQWFDRGPYGVRGGRHTLMLHADIEESIIEPNEADNFWVTQYVWSPLYLALDAPVVRDEPPSTGFTPLVNCDGMTFTRNAGAAWVVGMTPLASDDDYDLIVYEDYLDSQDGFDDQLAVSPAMYGETDFVVGHYSGTPVDVVAGVITSGASSHEPFAMQAADAAVHQGNNEGEFLFQFMGPHKMVDVYEVFLEGGDRVLFKLEKIEGGSDLKMHLFPGDPGGIYGVWDEHQVSTTFVEGEEWIVFESDDDAWYPLVVCRQDYRGLGAGLEYHLTWHPTGISAVEEETSAPTKLMFMAPSPNPSSHGSMLSFGLPEGGHVRLDVFDLRGHLVQTVVDRQYAAGRHQVQWTGRDDEGRQAATGVYYARLQFAGEMLTRRMTVLR